MPEGLPERAQVAVERAREFLAWTLKDVFDWNPQYLKELRGILNIIEVEFVFYIFYSFFYFFAGIAATSNVINRNSGQMQVEEGYNNFIGGGVSVFLTDRARL
ncbi:hypothetical protein TNCT_188852 [Trichonephila clavata]|uniref:Uncharacterized protein n=1 Tax=Trichonephila clavata TaxID=2740835 RepID=A0A8X6IE77_TRICU|nr:hypothetical protein TNCT_188852 [Trichonephila clavata]